MSFKVPEGQRVRSGPLASKKRSGCNGLFEIHKRGVGFMCIASDGMGWDHVSVHIVDEPRCPTWEEMCWIKSRFWGPEDEVVQFHPPASMAINFHNYCLHLWRSTAAPMPLPHQAMV